MCSYAKAKNFDRCKYGTANIWVRTRLRVVEAWNHLYFDDTRVLNASSAGVMNVVNDPAGII